MVELSNLREGQVDKMISSEFQPYTSKEDNLTSITNRQKLEQRNRQANKGTKNRLSGSQTRINSIYPHPDFSVDLPIRPSDLPP